MEGESSKPLTTDVPRFARGLSILLIHNDTSTLVNLKILLHEKYSFQVTATSNTSAAVSMILEDKGGFKMIMSKANMPGVDAPAFMYLMLGKRIPVIFILSGRIDDVNREKARARSCYFIDEPILLDKLQCILQEMYQSKLIYKECQDITAQESPQPQHSNNTEVDGEIRNHGKGKGKKYKSRMKRTENDRRKSDLGAVKSSSCSSDKAKFRSPAEGSSTGAQGVSLPAADQTQSEIVTVSNGGDSECTTVKVAMTKEQPAVASMDPPANEDDDLEVDSDTFGDWFSNNGITPPLYEMDEYTANLNNIFESPTPP